MERPGSSRIAGWTLAILVGLLALASAGYWRYDTALRDVAVRAEVQADLYRSSLGATLEKVQHLPVVLGRDALVERVLAGADPAALNRRLEEFAAAAQVEAIYVMDMSGLTVASSNWNAEISFLGQNYAFRPYFQQAQSGALGEFFAIGATTSKPGYFVAGPVGVQDNPAGVVAVKVGLETLTQAWADAGVPVLVSNADGVVVLSSDPSLLYRSLGQLDADRAAAIRGNRQFGEIDVLPLAWDQRDGISVTLDGTRYVSGELPVGRLGWRLHYLTPFSTIWAEVRVIIGGGLILSSLVLIGALVLRSQRIGGALKQSQTARRSLSVLNRKLEQEIEERREAEARLERAQADLARASKLAALGQLSASVTHELGQPISAMQNHIAAQRLAAEGAPEGFVARMQEIADRIEHITGQLRFFARSEDQDAGEVDLSAAVASAINLVEAEAERYSVRVDAGMADEIVTVRGNRLRLEQVVVNLLTNAIHAASEQPEGRVEVTLAQASGRTLVTVFDNGPGIAEDVRETLFEPFVSTKASGTGMGLGLAISAEIVRDHGGLIRAEPGSDGGTRFVIDLPAASMDMVA